jgi:replicative DNA helicase
MLDVQHPGPPHDIGTEQAVLAKALVDNRSMDAFARLKPDDFFNPTHAILFAEMQRRWREGKAMNLATLRGLLSTLPNITDAIDPFEYIRRLIAFGDTGNAHALADVLIEYANRRRLCETAHDLDLAARHFNSSVWEAANLAVAGLDTVLSVARRGRTSRSSADVAFREAVEAARSITPVDLVTTGLASVDAVLGGWRRQQFAILAGRPSMGKTAVATSSMLRTAKAGFAVLYFSLEMPTTALATRCLTDLAWAPDDAIAYSMALSQTLSQGGIDVLDRAADRWSQLPLTVDDQRGLSMAEIAARTRAEAQRFECAGRRLGLVIVDHLGLIKPSGRYAGNKVHEVAEVSDALATLAKEQDVAVLALHQLNRATEARDNKRPTLADLRNSGDLEQDADVVCFAYREAYYLERQKCADGSAQEARRQSDLEACRNTLELLIAKNRNGATTTVSLYCDMASNVVRDLAQEP